MEKAHSSGQTRLVEPACAARRELKPDAAADGARRPITYRL